MSNKPIIILVNPQLGENIGFVARTMSNFGFTELRIVNPRDGWPNKSAIATAVKAVNIIESAKIYDSFKESVADLEFLYAASARSRDFNKEYINSKNLKSDIETSNIRSNKIGILFGAEKSGLDNETISYADKILYIPTNTDSPSINIAISAGVICYELSDITQDKNSYQELASQKEVLNLFAHIEEMLDKTNFYKVPEKREKMTQNVRNIFKRIHALTSSEVNTLIGIIKALFEHGK